MKSSATHRPTRARFWAQQRADFPLGEPEEAPASVERPPLRFPLKEVARWKFTPAGMRCVDPPGTYPVPQRYIKVS